MVVVTEEPVHVSERLQSFETSVEGIGFVSSLADGWVGGDEEDMGELMIAGGASYTHLSMTAFFLAGGGARSVMIG